jgi:hypothetical protein
MTDPELAAYLARTQDAETPAQLVRITEELARMPASRERDTLQRTIRAAATPCGGLRGSWHRSRDTNSVRRARRDWSSPILAHDPGSLTRRRMRM